MYKRVSVFGMNVMEEIFEIRSCIKILTNDIIVDTPVRVQIITDKLVIGPQQDRCVILITEHTNQLLQMRW